MLDKLKRFFEQESIRKQAEKLKNTIDKKYGTNSKIDIYMYENKAKAKRIAEDISHDFGVKPAGDNHNGSNWYDIILERIKVTVFF